MIPGAGASDSEIHAAGDHAPEAAADSELARLLTEGRGQRYQNFLLAALGSIPWIGGAVAGVAGLRSDLHQEEVSQLLMSWLREHQRTFRDLQEALEDIVTRLEQVHEHVSERLQSEEYLSLVRQAFRAWDDAHTTEKRRLIQNLITNAAASTVCSDDVVRLFLVWLESYSDLHFRVIGEIYKSPGITRYGIWQQIYGRPEREDSAEADLYKLLIRDLFTGSVIRQHRETDGCGQFVPRSRRKRGTSLKSAFDDEEPYELTELGRQFVHYAMDELVPRISGNQQRSEANDGPGGSD